MKRLSIPFALALTLALAAPAQAAVKSATKPSAPTITSVTNGAVKKGKVNITVTFTLPADLGGLPVKQTKVSAGGKSCTAKKAKTSCTIKGIKNGKAVSVTAKTQNKKGYGPASAAVSHQAGSGVAAASNETKAQENARKSAKSYLNYSAFSRSGLIKQLEYEKYSNADATYGVDAQGADWNVQAVKSGTSYLKYSAFSRTGLIRQLEYEGFSPEQAVFGTDSQGADWNVQAAKSAESYLKYSSFSRASLISQLEYEGFTTEQATYGVTANGY
jgi:hypothetical protein